MSDIDWETKVRFTCPRCGFASVTPQAVLDGHVRRVTQVECPKDGTILAQVKKRKPHDDRQALC